MHYLKILRNFIPALILLLLSTSCEHKTTVVESRYPDQSPKTVKTYLVRGDEKRLIEEKTYYEGNKIQMEGKYKDNKRDGRWVYYHSNGKPWSEGYFSKGKANGKRVTYHENGKILYEGFYKDDKRVGKWKFYDNKGLLLKELDFSAPEAQAQADSLTR